MTERDDDDVPLDDLRRAWSQLGAPRPDAELADCDEPTRAAVAWMQVAWSRVQVPQSSSADAELAQRDERTRVALAWMQEAWSNVQAPLPSIPAERAAASRSAVRADDGSTVSHPILRAAAGDATFRNRSSGRPRNRARLRTALLSLAAAALAALGLWTLLQRSKPGVRPGDVGNAVAGNDGSEQPAIESAPALAADDVQLAALSPERVELCSGPVCLILLTGEGSPRTR
jgi:hypothetical protein